jgi:hypothetical protein
MTGDRSSGAHRRGRVSRRRLPAVIASVVAVVIVSAVVVVVIAPWTGPAVDARDLTRPPLAGFSQSPTAPPGDGVGRGSPPETAPAFRFPDGSTTGVPAGVELTSSGSISVRDDGAVLENLSIVDGLIEVRANDVTIRNVRITNDTEFVQWGIIQETGYQGLVVEDSEIFGNSASPHQFASGISNHGGAITIRRVEIHTITDGIVTSAGLIEDSYLHSPRLFPDDHTDMVQANGGPQGDLQLVIRNNTIINTEDQTGAVSLFDNFRRVRDVLVEGNLLAGGGYTLYGGGLTSEGSNPANIVVRNNVFSRRVWPESGFWGPSAYFDEDAPGNLWSGNVWEDDGSPVILERQN